MIKLKKLGMTSTFIALVALFGCISENNLDEQVSLEKINIATIENNVPQKDSLKFDVKDGVYKKYVRISNDTLHLVTEDNLFYFPFGKFDNISSFESSFPFLEKEVEVHKSDVDLLIYKMKWNSSFIKLFKDDETGELKVVSARLFDNKISFYNNVAVGITKEELLSNFFNSISKSSIENVNVVEVESALTGIWYYHHFKNNSLTSILIKTDYIFNQE